LPNMARRTAAASPDNPAPIITTSVEEFTVVLDGGEDKENRGEETRLPS